MALTSELLRANAATAGLTDEQVSAIVTMSQNDESSVIGQKTGEIYGGLDADILASSGIAKNGTEKTYDYAKRVIGEIKAKAGEAAELQTKLDTALTEQTRLQGIIDKGGADEETKRQLAQAKADLENVTRQFNELKTTHDASEEKHKTDLFNFRLSSDLAAASAGIKFKADLPKTVTDVLMKQAIAQVKGFNPQYVDNGAGGETLVFMENGAVKRNPNNALNPFTATELLTSTLNDMGVLEKPRTQTGTGTHFTTPTGEGVNVDLNGARTQAEAYEAITKSLLAQGKTLGSKEFEEAMQKAWKDNNIKALPVK